jgi:hypothetical protein
MVVMMMLVTINVDVVVEVIVMSGYTEWSCRQRWRRRRWW